MVVPFLLIFSANIPRQSSSPLFPYTTLFRSESCRPGYARLLGTEYSLDQPARRYGRVLVFRAVLQPAAGPRRQDRKSTRLNSSHVEISYAVFCLKKKVAAKAFSTER